MIDQEEQVRIEDEAAAGRGSDTPATPSPAPREFATPDALPSVEFEEVFLPDMKKWVCVRYLGAPEVAEMAMIPELKRFGEIMAKATEIAQKNAQRDQDKPAATLSDEDTRESISQQMKWLVWSAHVVVLRDPTEPDAQVCKDCGMEHRPSLWTKAQTSLLSYNDLKIISATAEREDRVDPTLPSLEDSTESATDDSARSGESTQEPTSSE